MEDRGGHGRKERRSATRSKTFSSKYDFVKVRVELSSQHYYVLSRFLVSRMLTAARIRQAHALRIALDLKKRLVDRDILVISQKDMERELFWLMARLGYGMENIILYRKIAWFHHQRIPLILLVAGTACIGKSTIATQLAERLNLSNVVKTDVVYDLIQSIEKRKTPDPIWIRAARAKEPSVAAGRFDTAFRDIQLGLEGDLQKTLTDGKSIIIEGSLINHQLLDIIVEKRRKNIAQSAEDTAPGHEAASSKHKYHVSPDCAIVPILLTFEDTAMHRYLVDEWCLRNSPAWTTQVNGGDDDVSTNAIYKVMRQWQDDLLAENNRRLKDPLEQQQPFYTVSMDFDNMETTLNIIHQHVLDAIAELCQESDFVVDTQHLLSQDSPVKRLSDKAIDVSLAALASRLETSSSGHGYASEGVLLSRRPKDEDSDDSPQLQRGYVTVHEIDET
ncbi:hypothetical protein BZG36_01995 [Bifiguratus adelaidae]|uniref:2-phosphoglycerate kinase n=1 Tax=Bifiguratus adelaidae TaxID=1938954 RepID=A0A261Y427_9FUNG|nr:hypothetical protein BZG36_01995 [Bifiguratus adelaidae]